MVGGLLGFLFGIPRTLQEERPPDVLQDAANAGRGPEYRVNTNLEQISDWLTKILVGAGLVQLGDLTNALGRLADRVGDGLGNTAAATNIALATLVYFAASGFLIAYLWTRLLLTGAFARAEAEALRGYVDKSIENMATQVEQRIDDVEKSVEQQHQDDARALSLLTRQLDPDQPEVSKDELIEAVGAASTPVKIQIFQQGRAQRAKTWQTDLARMQRTIRIFEALIASDPEHRFHRHFAQLAYALKDKQPADVVKAELLLSEAIRIRGTRGTFRTYEFARAECRIRLGRPPDVTEEQHRAAIHADLSVAATHPSLASELSEPGSAFAEWMREEGITVADLRSAETP